MMAAKPDTDTGGKFAFWDTPLIPVLVLHNGRQILKSEYFNRGGAEKFGHGVRMHYHFDRRECVLPDCKSADLLVDSRGYSFFPHCQTVYNDGIPPRATKNQLDIHKSAKRFLRRSKMKM
jgi:hypothetical protein